MRWGGVVIIIVVERIPVMMPTDHKLQSEQTRKESARIGLLAAVMIAC